MMHDDVHVPGDGDGDGVDLNRDGRLKPCVPSDSRTGGEGRRRDQVPRLERAPRVLDHRLRFCFDSAPSSFAGRDAIDHR